MNYLDQLEEFKKYLLQEEKSQATIGKYVRDVRGFLRWCDGKALSKEIVLNYKGWLVEQYAPASVNSMIASINCFLRFVGRGECCVKQLKIQRQLFSSEDKELSKDEYRRLTKAAKESRIGAVIQTICGTGIRVSELCFITVEAVTGGKAVVNCKNKTRVIFIPVTVQKLLKIYIRKNGIKAGPVFVTRNGKPLDRSNIWKEMKALCKRASVSEKKVFPHNLRHLFARLFYSIEKDVVRLADLLGHSSINTTRIYTMDTGRGHIRSIEKVMQRLMLQGETTNNYI